MHAKDSWRDLVRRLPPDQLREAIWALSEDEADAVLCDWRGMWARPSQVAPEGDWLDWVLLAGRGYGKTRTGAEWMKEQIEAMPGARGAIVATSFADARDTCVEGESGLLSVLPRKLRPPDGAQWNRTNGELRFSNGTRVKLFSSVEPGNLRGPQFHFSWCDELAGWKRQWEAWDQLKFGLRLPWHGRPARTLVSTTPRPVKIIRDLVKAPTSVVTRGTSYDNLHNLSPSYRQIIAKYEGTTLGRQELRGEIIDDIPGALWTRQGIEACRRMPPLIQRRALEGGGEDYDLVRIVVGVDPAVTSGEDSDETGIVAVGLGADGHRYVLEDVSGRMKPEVWAGVALDLYFRLKADRIVGEVNNGGDLVEATIRAEARTRANPDERSFAFRAVTASRGKRTRAEPIAVAYERGTVHHAGVFELLEDELCTWVPDSGMPSPDRMDAMVWAATELDRPGFSIA